MVNTMLSYIYMKISFIHCKREKSYNKRCSLANCSVYLADSAFLCRRPDFEFDQQKLLINYIVKFS